MTPLPGDPPTRALAAIERDRARLLADMRREAMPTVKELSMKHKARFRLACEAGRQNSRRNARG